jgi:5-methylcytosine-specific restriction protein A
MTARSVPEWIGKTPDTPAPPRVRLRVFEAFGGRCAICGCKIGATVKWALDHIIALINGGENRESNLQPICDGCHKIKTRADVAEKSKTSRIREKYLGIRPHRSRPMPGSRQSKWKRCMDGTVTIR